MKKATMRLLVTSVVAVLAAPAPALADSHNDVKALMQQLEALQARVSALEAQRSFASFMPDFAERFHVMHRAGEAEDWAVASHELAELTRLSEASLMIDSSKGKLMQGMMQQNFDDLSKAIEHGNSKKFEQALEQTVSTCNACHTATGSDFIEVILDETQALSMRHPHQLRKRGVPEGHSHAMAKPSAEKKAAHDDTGKPAHNDAGMPMHKN